MQHIKKKTSVVEQIDTPAPEKTPAETTPTIAVGKPSPPVEQKPTVKKYGTTGLSMDDLLNTPVKKAETTSVKVDNKDVGGEQVHDEQAFDNEALIVAWRDYAAELEITQPRVFSILTAAKPVKKSETVVQYTLFTDPQIQLFKQEVKQGILHYLQKTLKNGKISIELIEGKQEKLERKPYSSKERFEYLNNINPLLTKLKEEFDLDL